MAQTEIQLTRNAAGRLVLRDAEGQVHDGVVPVRAFPISAADEGVAIVSAEGREVCWFPTLADVPDAVRHLVEEELGARDFMPQILRIVAVSTFATPSTWEVETDRGPTRFVLRGEEDIRRLAGGTLLISDSHGIHYLIRGTQSLDKASRKLLDRFL
ncbi:DUF1854 domain-containing protein [Cupriavidus sp. AU9028]|uniref:cyanophycin metabolism-associated DUF1854 family protein n=1 Tax=Cupriavidus sp. AU9028 TaxID=2871157 RepID=UPI001C965586|nr:DUF1854 domain-containing protein [Cupriavidus sp. AU9028]MBY4895577.1 DUF1854 domain-containing protein [Cupriavidus sp. AU9028]